MSAYRLPTKIRSKESSKTMLAAMTSAKRRKVNSHSRTKLIKGPADSDDILALAKGHENLL